MHKILPSHFPELQYRPLVMTAVDNDQEQIALTILQAGATYHVAGKVCKQTYEIKKKNIYCKNFPQDFILIKHFYSVNICVAINLQR